MLQTGRGRVLMLLAVVALGLYAWWVMGLRPFTTPALVVTVATGLAAMAAGSLVSSRKPVGEPVRSQAGGGVALWGALIVALGAWELVNFVQLPRAEHPTLSSLANLVFDTRSIRAAAFALWVAGAYKVARK